MSDLEEMKVAHRRLTTRFAEALGAAARVERLPAGVADEEQRSGELTGRSVLYAAMVRLLTGAHVRKQLGRLAARCSELESSLPSDQPATRSWLETVRSDAERTAASLPSLRIPGVFGLAPFVIAAVTGVSKLVDGDVPEGVVIAVTGLLLLFGPISLWDLRHAFRCKRELLLPGAGDLDRMPLDQQVVHTGPNAYRDANMLFELLGSRRTPEAQLDLFATVLGPFVFAALAFFAGVLFDDSVVVAGGGLVVGFVLLIVIVVLDKRSPKRVWN